MKKDKRVYLDYAATTPVDPRVFKAMSTYFSDKFGNAGSLHSYGQEAMAAIDKSREVIAKLIGAKFEEIVFTSSATEANNLALRGLVSGMYTKYKIQNTKYKPRLIISAIEHESILETARDLESSGLAEVIYLPVDKNGMIDSKELQKSINERTVLVSIMYANNEIGTIQPIQEVARIVRNYKETNPRVNRESLIVNHYPLFHTDAVQAFNYLDCNVDNLHVDMMTLSSHKIYGPKGAGCLYIRNLSRADLAASGYSLVPILTGGGQEFGYRSSTENVPAIVGFGKAAELASDSRESESQRIGELRDYLWRKLKKICPKTQVNGGTERKLPNNLNVHIPGINVEDLLIRLDLAGIAASSGSACKSRAIEPSYVIKAMGFSDDRAKKQPAPNFREVYK